MNILLSIFFSFLIVFNLNAGVKFSDFKGCGQYLMGGIVRKDSTDFLQLIINEKSKSEYKLKIASDSYANLGGFIDKQVFVKATVLKMDGTYGELNNASEIKVVLESKLLPKSTSGFKLLMKGECKK